MALIGILLAVAIAGQAAETSPIRKGPYLFYHAGALMVRIETKGDETPILEWRVDGRTHRETMAAVSGGWQGAIPRSATAQKLAYRVMLGEGGTDWIQYLAQRTRPQAFRFIVYGDNREGWKTGSAIHRQIQERMIEAQPAFVVHTGDIVYDGNKERMWDDLFQKGRSFFQALPFYPVMGNHDRSGRNRFADLWPLGAKGATYYAMEQGGAGFLMIDTTIRFNPGSPQYRFIQETLSRWQAQGVSPVFAFFHNPPFNGGKHGDNANVKKSLVPLFEEHGVDIVFGGHDHNYQRIGPINGVLYIITGGGGGPLYDVRPHPELKDYKVQHHYVLVEVNGKRVRGQVRNLQNAVEDSFEIDHTTKNDAIRLPHPKLR